MTVRVKCDRYIEEKSPHHQVNKGSNIVTFLKCISNYMSSCTLCVE